MPRVCSICSHPKVKQIEKDLKQFSTSEIAKRYGLTTSSLQRHRKHLEVVEAAVVEVTAGGFVFRLGQEITVLGQLSELRRATEEVIKQSFLTGDYLSTVKALEARRKEIDLEAKVLGVYKHGNIDKRDEYKQLVEQIYSEAIRVGFNLTREDVIAKLSDFPITRDIRLFLDNGSK